MRKVVCPYCFQRFQLRDVGFRCLAQLTGQRTNVRCEIGLDQPLATYIGSPGPANLGPVFSADGSKRKATCPNCGVETYTRVCPTCHNDLPPDFGQIGTRIIALIGAKESGKSTYITVLIRELRHRVGSAFGASVEAMDDRTIRTYKGRFEDVLYRQHVMLPTTQPASVDTNYPLLYRFSSKHRGLVRTHTRSSSLVLFDTAGEDLQDRESIDTHVRYLKEAHGIVLLIDPLQIDAIRELVGADVTVPLKDTPPDEIVTNITQLIRSARGMKADARIRTPIAVAFSKIDALWPLVPPGSRLQQRSDHAGAFDERDRTELNDEIESLLDKWEGGLLSRHLEQHYSHYGFFGLSSLGAAPIAAAVPAHGISPFRVEDPVLWLLAKTKIIPSRRPRP